MGVNFIFVQHPRVLAIIEVRNSLTRASILGVVVDELRHG